MPKKQQCRTYRYKSLKSRKIDNIDLTQQFSLSISTDFRYQSIKITWLLSIFINWPLRVVCLKPTVNFENQRYLALLTCSLMAESINLGFSSTLIIPNITKTGFILAIGQWGSNGPPSVIWGDPFSRKGGPQKVFELIGTDCSKRKRTFIEIIIYRLASTEHEVKMTLML